MAIDSLTDAVQSTSATCIPEKLPYVFRHPYSNEIHHLTKARTYCRNKFRAGGNTTFHGEMNRYSRLIKAAISKVNQKSKVLRRESWQPRCPEQLALSVREMFKEQKSHCHPLNTKKFLSRVHKRLIFQKAGRWAKLSPFPSLLKTIRNQPATVLSRCFLA